MVFATNLSPVMVPADISVAVIVAAAMFAAVMVFAAILAEVIVAAAISFAVIVEAAMFVAVTLPVVIRFPFINVEFHTSVYVPEALVRTRKSSFPSAGSVFEWENTVGEASCQ